jgi:hypothetical protein
MVCPPSGNMAWKQCFMVYQPFEIKKFLKEILSCLLL